MEPFHALKALIAVSVNAPLYIPTRHTPLPRPRHTNQKNCAESGLNYNVSLPANGAPVKEVVVFCHGMGQSGASAMRMIRETVRAIKPNAAIYTPSGGIEPVHGMHDRGHLWVGIPMGRDEEGQKIKPSREMERKIYRAANQLNTFADARLREHRLERHDLTMGGWSEGAMMATHTALAHEKTCNGIYAFSGPIYHLRQPNNNSPLYYTCSKGDEVVYPTAHRHSLTAIEKLGINAVVHVAEPTIRICWNRVRNWHYEGKDHPSGRRRLKYLKTVRTTGHDIHPSSVHAAAYYHATGHANPLLNLVPANAVSYKPLNIGLMERIWPLMASSKRRLLFVHSEQMAEEALSKMATALTARPLKTIRTFALAANIGRAMTVAAGELPPPTPPERDGKNVATASVLLPPSLSKPMFLKAGR